MIDGVAKVANCPVTAILRCILCNYPAAPHLLCHRPAYVQAAHFAGLFLASGALLNSYSTVVFVHFRHYTG